LFQSCADKSQVGILFLAAAVVTENPDLQRAFLKYMQGSEAKTIFKRAGFTLP